MSIQIVERKSRRHIGFADTECEAADRAYRWASAAGRSVVCIHIPTSRVVITMPPQLTTGDVGHFLFCPRGFVEERATAWYN